MGAVETNDRTRRIGRRQRRTIVVGSVVAFIIAAMLVALVILTQRTAERSQAATAMELQTVQVMLQTQRFLSALLDVETGERGYLLTADRTFLAPHHRGRAQAPIELDQLHRLTVDNPVQRRNIAALQQLMQSKIAISDDRVAEASHGNIADARAATSDNRGKVAMEDVRRVIAAVLAEEDRLLVIRRGITEAATDASRHVAMLVIGFGAAVLLGLIVVGWIAARTARAARRLAREKRVAELVGEQLEARVAERTRELEAANDQVRQMQKMEAIGQLTGGIAHDFNNMLSIVIGSLDLALRRMDRDRGDIRPLIDNAIAGANRAATLTARLLAFSRQQTLVPTVLDCNALVAGMDDLLRRTLGEGVRIETVLAGGLWPTHADAGQVENAIVNLAVNARDAMDARGSLTIETANFHLDDAYAAANSGISPGQYVLIAVTDTGMGMPPEVVARAFDPFFTTKPVGKGTGLGLSQVFGFVKQSLGHVKVYSEPGRGTTIKLYLPRYHGAEDAAVASDVVPAEMPRAAPGEAILVVEDEAQVRDMSVAALRDLGYVVRYAGDGETALRLLAEGLPVTLLFTDIVMPGINGRELADRAQAMRPGLKVLYTTGYTRNAVVNDGTLDPGTAVLPKPFGIADLAAKIRMAIDARPAA